MGDRLLHHPRALDHLRQEHLSRAEQVAHDIHPVHQRPLDHVERTPGGDAGLFGVFDHERVDAVDQGVGEACLDGLVPPFVLAPGCGFRPGGIGNRQKPLGRIVAAGEHHILDALAEFGLYVFVYAELARVDDPHVHPGADRVVEKDRVHRLAQRVVAAERERDVGDPAADQRVRQRFLDALDRLDEVERGTGRAPRFRSPRRRCWDRR